MNRCLLLVGLIPRGNYRRFPRTDQIWMPGIGSRLPPIDYSLRLPQKAPNFTWARIISGFSPDGTAKSGSGEQINVKALTQTRKAIFSFFRWPQAVVATMHGKCLVSWNDGFKHMYHWKYTGVYYSGRCDVHLLCIVSKRCLVGEFYIAPRWRHLRNHLTLKIDI